MQLHPHLGIDAEHGHGRWLDVEVGEQTVGFLVDAVCDIMSMIEDELHPAPDAAYDPNHSFVRGLLTVEDRVLVLVKLEGAIH